MKLLLLGEGGGVSKERMEVETEEEEIRINCSNQTESHSLLSVITFRAKCDL